MRAPPRRWRLGALVLLGALGRVAADFLFAAGNWTHDTNLFSTLHFLPGYNAAGEWDIITGGNWTPTNHTDLRMLGDAAVYLCPCPMPPCEIEDGPAKPGFNTSIFTCVDPEQRNASYAMCTTYHADSTNVTCVTPEFAVSCDLPQFEPECQYLVTTSRFTVNGLVTTTTCEDRWYNNTELPSRSFYSDQVTAVSCTVRGMGEQPMDHVGNFLSAPALHAALVKEECRLECKQVCQTVCVHRHQSVDDIFRPRGVPRDATRTMRLALVRPLRVHVSDTFCCSRRSWGGTAWGGAVAARAQAAQE